MATKTISIDLEAYERLARERLDPKESFSQVIKRARWQDSPRTCRGLLEVLGGLASVGDEVLERLEAAQVADAPPDDEWRAGK